MSGGKFSLYVEMRTEVGSSSLHVGKRGHGDTVEAIFKDAQDQLLADGYPPPTGTMMIVGAHNKRADWEALYGPQPRNLMFADDDLTKAEPLPHDDIH